MSFLNRREAGKKLAEALRAYQGKKGVVVAIPRGGVVVAREVAKSLKMPLDILVMRKLGAPGNPELAIGAVVSEKEYFLNPSIIKELGVSSSYIAQEIEKQAELVKERKEKYLKGRKPVECRGKVVILVDDGLATGATARLALEILRKRQPSKLILAIPVAPPGTVRDLSALADEVVALMTPSFFYAVGQFYTDFSPVSDEEVVKILEEQAGPGLST